jgi:hypothetical protein
MHLVIQLFVFSFSKTQMHSTFCDTKPSNLVNLSYCFRDLAMSMVLVAFIPSLITSLLMVGNSDYCHAVDRFLQVWRFISLKYWKRKINCIKN